jgi:hypothetical protein
LDVHDVVAIAVLVHTWNFGRNYTCDDMCACATPWVWTLDESHDLARVYNRTKLCLG